MGVHHLADKGMHCFNLRGNGCGRVDCDAIFWYKRDDFVLHQICAQIVVGVGGCVSIVDGREGQARAERAERETLSRKQRFLSDPQHTCGIHISHALLCALVLVELGCGGNKSNAERTNRPPHQPDLQNRYSENFSAQPPSNFRPIERDRRMQTATSKQPACLPGISLQVCPSFPPQPHVDERPPPVHWTYMFFYTLTLELITSV